MAVNPVRITLVPKGAEPDTAAAGEYVFAV